MTTPSTPTTPAAAQGETLTDEQVEHWRRVLMMTVGPYALLMSREQIQSYRDRMQAAATKAVSEKGAGEMTFGDIHVLLNALNFYANKENWATEWIVKDGDKEVSGVFKDRVVLKVSNEHGYETAKEALSRFKHPEDEGAFDDRFQS